MANLYTLGDDEYLVGKINVLNFYSMAFWLSKVQCNGSWNEGIIFFRNKKLHKKDDPSPLNHHLGRTCLEQFSKHQTCKSKTDDSNSTIVHEGVPGAIAPITHRMRFFLAVAQTLGTKPKQTYNLFIFMEGSLLTFVFRQDPKDVYIFTSINPSLETFTQQLPFLKTYLIWNLESFTGISTERVAVGGVNLVQKSS